MPPAGGREVRRRHVKPRQHIRPRCDLIGAAVPQLASFDPPGKRPRDAAFPHGHRAANRGFKETEVRKTPFADVLLDLMQEGKTALGFGHGLKGEGALGSGDLEHRGQWLDGKDIYRPVGDDCRCILGGGRRIRCGSGQRSKPPASARPEPTATGRPFYTILWRSGRVWSGARGLRCPGLCPPQSRWPRECP